MTQTDMHLSLQQWTPQSLQAAKKKEKIISGLFGTICHIISCDEAISIDLFIPLSSRFNYIATDRCDFIRAWSRYSPSPSGGLVDSCAHSAQSKLTKVNLYRSVGCVPTRCGQNVPTTSLLYCVTRAAMLTSGKNQLPFLFTLR